MAALRDIACRLGGRSAVLALGLLALAVPAASAATATVSSGALTYTAATGETNQLTITRSGGTFTLSDSGALITAGAGCASGGARIVTCTAASLSVDTGDRDDVITVGAGAPATLNGGSGNDQLLDPSGGAANTFIGGTGTDRVSYAGRAAAITADIDGVADDGAPGELDNVRTDVEYLYGGMGADHLTGGTAANRLVGMEGDDVLDGAGGDDTIDGGPGADTFIGGAGRDYADYSARTNPLTVGFDDAADSGEAGEGDNLHSDLEGAYGGSAADLMLGGPGSDDLRGNGGDDTFRGGAGADTFAGGAGQDTADYSDRSTPVTVDDDGVADDGAAGEQDNAGSDVENLVGGSGNDVITGNGSANTLSGGVGNDTLSGGAGNDTLRGEVGDDTLRGDANDDVIDGGAGADSIAGGSGTDTADYSLRSNRLTVSIGNGSGDGEGNEGDDVQADIEKVTGGSGNDVLVGSAASETLDGGAGDDRLDGGAGADTLTGGTGTDVADYSSRSSNLTVDLDNNADDGAIGERDNVRTDVENVTGGSADDRLTGDGFANALSGGGGNDTLIGGAGADRLAGGDGTDTADYSDRTSPVAASIDGVANDGEAGEGDDVAGDVERLNGGSAGDTLSGDEHANTLTGGAGADVLAGGGGDDTLDGGDGDDALRGGYGADRLTGGRGSDTIDFSDRGDAVTADLGSRSTSDGDVVAADIENAAGGAGADRLLGDDGANTLSGGGGDDVLAGRGGADKLEGGGGSDTADYSERRYRVTVTLNGAADDGEIGERDLVGGDVENVTGGAGNDYIVGDGQANRLAGGPGSDTLTGGAGVDTFDGGDGNDQVNSKDGKAESSNCGSGLDRADVDKADKLKGCELRGRIGPPPTSGSPTAPKPSAPPSGVKGVRTIVGGAKIVPIPGFPGERVDKRLLKDIAWMVAKYKIRVTDGYALEGHAPRGEHPLGEAIDIVPGPGGTWDDIDRLAKFAEPRQNHPRAPWRWVGYNGDANHGRGNHLHLSWNHAPSKRGHPGRWVQVMTYQATPRKPTVRSLKHLALQSNFRLGRAPSVSSGVTMVPTCSGSTPLKATWKAAGAAFGVRWQVLAAITQIESRFGCNMGPSSAGAIGWTQFLPGTWQQWGMDADGDAIASPYNSADAIFSTARFLRAKGAPRNYRGAIFAYNHAHWYVNQVLALSKGFSKASFDLGPGAPPTTAYDLAAGAPFAQPRPAPTHLAPRVPAGADEPPAPR